MGEVGDGNSVGTSMSNLTTRHRVLGLKLLEGCPNDLIEICYKIRQQTHLESQHKLL